MRLQDVKGARVTNKGQLLDGALERHRWYVDERRVLHDENTQDFRIEVDEVQCKRRRPNS